MWKWKIVWEFCFGITFTILKCDNTHVVHSSHFHVNLKATWNVKLGLVKILVGKSHNFWMCQCVGQVMWCVKLWKRSVAVGFLNAWQCLDQVHSRPRSINTLYEEDFSHHYSVEMLSLFCLNYLLIISVISHLYFST